MFWFVLLSVDAFCKLVDGKKYFKVLSFQLYKSKQKVVMEIYVRVWGVVLVRDFKRL